MEWRPEWVPWLMVSSIDVSAGSKKGDLRADLVTIARRCVDRNKWELSVHTVRQTGAQQTFKQHSNAGKVVCEQGELFRWASQSTSQNGTSSQRWKTTALQVPRHKVYRHERVSEIPRINICTQYPKGEVENENCHKWEKMWRGFWEERDTFQLGSVDLEMNCINFGEVILGAVSYMYIFNWNIIGIQFTRKWISYMCVCVCVCVCIHTYIPPHLDRSPTDPPPPSHPLSHHKAPELSFLGFTAGSHKLSLLHMVVCVWEC